MDDGRDTRMTLLTVLLACGIASSLIYVGSDVIGALRYPGYSYASQAFSELLAIGSPVRPFMMWTAALYNALVIAFGIGVMLSADAKRSLMVTGALLVFYGIVSGAGPYIPMHVRGTTTVMGDLSHILITAATVVAILAFVAVGSVTGGRAFMVYSLVPIAASIAGGVLAGQQVSVVAAGQPSPLLGIIERVNIYATMLWVAVFSISLLRA